MIPFVSVTSGETGSGATTTAVNLAVSLALGGRRVLLIDCAEKAGCLAGAAGTADGSVPYTPLLKIMRAETADLSSIKHEAELGTFEWIIADVPHMSYLTWGELSSHTVLVTTMEESSIPCADGVVGKLESIGISPAVILNRYDPEKDSTMAACLSYTLSDNVIGWITHMKASESAFPVALYPDQDSAQRFRHAARNLKDGTNRSYRTLRPLSAYGRGWKKLTSFLQFDAGDRRIK
ncbi:septum site-determining protein MinD [Alkalicoccus luteus]|uniref:Septum site-determining protein MinD n=1 Tax=Alkalicoccus luteus TaxID=1237094 RepID=A0A969PWT5_9BACI|nr:septum site-determining protein MinD [Alkalicoccus luteus]NJP38929.1 septum site-determining protein MinD [Alkalicoccus luteus]